MKASETGPLNDNPNQEYASHPIRNTLLGVALAAGTIQGLQDGFIQTAAHDVYEFIETATAQQHVDSPPTATQPTRLKHHALKRKRHHVNPRITPPETIVPANETASASHVTIMSMNVLGSNHVGNAAGRAAASVHFALSRGAQILTTAEMQKDQFGYFHQQLGANWSSYPASTNVDGFEYKRSIFFNDSFEYVTGGQIWLPGYGAENLEQLTDAMPWVLLREKASNQYVLVSSAHLVAEERANVMPTSQGLDPMGTLKREREAEILARTQLALRKAYPFATLILGGDFNGRGKLRTNQSPNDDALHGNRNLLTYCILGNSGEQLTQDAATNPNSTGCPSKNVQLMQQYVMGGHTLKVYFKQYFSNDTKVSGTDHYWTPESTILLGPVG